MDRDKDFETNGVYLREKIYKTISLHPPHMSEGETCTVTALAVYHGNEDLKYRKWDGNRSKLGPRILPLRHELKNRGYVKLDSWKLEGEPQLPIQQRTKFEMVVSTRDMSLKFTYDGPNGKPAVVK